MTSRQNCPAAKTSHGKSLSGKSEEGVPKWCTALLACTKQVGSPLPYDVRL